MRPKVTLGILPLGTANDFAKARSNHDRSLRMRNSSIQRERIIHGMQIMDTV